MNPADPHLTLTLSPPIRWERRGNSRRMLVVALIHGSKRLVQGFNGPADCIEIANCNWGMAEFGIVQSVWQFGWFNVDFLRFETLA